MPNMPAPLKLRYSLSLKLILLFIITGIIILIAFRAFVGASFKQHFENNIQPHFQQYLRHLHQEIGYPPNLKRAEELSETMLVDIIIDGPDTHWSSSGEFPVVSDIHLKAPKNIKDSSFQRGFYQRQFVIRIQNKEYSMLFITRGSIGHVDRSKALLMGLGIILGLLILLYLAIRHLFHPIKIIQADVKRIGSGELSHRIALSDRNELGELAGTINQMADDIEQILEAKHQLLLAISHELRSPITRAKVALSLMGDNGQKDELGQNLQEMEDLIHELLEAERLKNKHSALNLSECSLNKLVQTVITSYYPTADVTLQLTSDLPLLLDEARIRFTIKNLLGNALKSQQADSDPIVISSNHDGENIELTIVDHGAGIATEHIAHLTEPFYRADPSRQRKTGGYGLGLYLVKLIMEAHGGNLDIQSKLNHGTTATLSFPFAIQTK
ncbi:MAG: HAMP domain-containing sensor histidine kinase [Thiotrichaceae bacterium]